MISDFIAADPLLDARRAIDIRRLLGMANDPVLLVTFGLPGGVKRHVEERQSLLRSTGHTVVVLQPGPSERKEQVILRVQDSGMENLTFNLPEDLPMLRALLQGLRLSSIELHHFAGLPAAALEMVANLGIPYDVYVHDYSWICPRLTLVGENGGYCGEPPVDECEACIRKLGTALEESLTVEALRLRSARILAGAKAVIVPSRDVRSRLARYFPALAVQVMGWEKPFTPMPRTSRTPSGRVHVAVIGAISIPKGHQILMECARDAAERGLDLDFVVIGYTEDDEALLKTGCVFITGPYVDSEVGVLLEREQAHIAFFPSIVPETWSYALSHALSRSLPIVAFDLGAIAERLRTYEAAELLPLRTAAAGINDALLRSARKIDTSNAQHKELAMEPTPTTNNEAAASSEPVSRELAASVQLLTLPVGTYAFTVKGGASTGTPSEELTLPALQVGLAPMRSPGTAEFLAGATTLDRWLARGSDVILLRISGGSVSLLLTSLRLPSSPFLAIDVRRVDALAQTEEAGLQTGAATSPDQSGVLPVQIGAHIQNAGDIHFNEGWAGCLGDKLWIEAFAILSVGDLPPDAIEYCGVTADGFQTPWVSGQTPCGSRGQGLPMLGYAVRLKPEIAARYDCAYSGRFVSGSMRGPFTAGELCCSDAPGDPLWGIELRVAARRTVSAQKPSAEMQYSSDVA
jgi:glycosyltransferase involved in cell wall biosynthesis